MNKKVSGFMLTLAIGVALVGCKKEVPTLLTTNISYNTLLVLDEGVTQSAMIEDFEKDYYNRDELVSFIEDSIEGYTKIAGVDTVKLESCEVESKVVTAKFSYKTLDHYSKFNETESALLTAEEALASTSIVGEFISEKDGKVVDKETALKDTKYKVLVTNSPGYNIIVDGTVKYYANAIVLNDSSVQASNEGVTVVIYK